VIKDLLIFELWAAPALGRPGARTRPRDERPNPVNQQC
jgi:hypothetical protein